MDRQVSTERILAAADQLSQLFLNSGYPPRRTKTSDGEMLVFKAEGADKHVTVLRLAAAPSRRAAAVLKGRRPLQRQRFPIFSMRGIPTFIG